MDFTQAVKAVFSKYVTFSGRARRAEYWWFALFQLLCGIALSIVDHMLFGRPYSDTGPLEGIFSLLIFLPAISVMVRRLHDGDRSGWWFWIILIPLVGALFLLYWLVSKGTTGPNDYGPDPIIPSTDVNGLPTSAPVDNTPLSPSGVPRVPRK